jgi:hypothetical protein
MERLEDEHLRRRLQALNSHLHLVGYKLDPISVAHNDIRLAGML